MSIGSTITGDLKKFESVLVVVGKDFQKGLTVAVKYLPEATILAGFLFPPAVAPLTEATVTANLIQGAIVAVEQKYAAQGQQSGTGSQKAADVLTLVNDAVSQILNSATIKSQLASAGIAVNTTYISNLINAVVAFLNIRGAVATPAASSTTQVG